MPIARYWRINAIDTYAGGDLELSALHLYDATGRIDVTATLTCSHAPSYGSLANLQDADTSSLCRFASAHVHSPGFFVQWDFGTGGVDVDGLRVGGAALKDGFLAQCDLSYSGDCTFWTVRKSFNQISWPGGFALTPVIKPADSYFEKVVLLLPCDGVAGSTDFIDNSPRKKIVTAVGGAVISTAQSNFGGASAAFNGSSGYLSAPASADFDFGTADFTIELWAWRANLPSAYGHFFCVGDQGLFTFKHWGAALYCYSDSSGSLCIVTDVFPAETMCHLALVRTGSVFKIYVNGAQKATSSYAGTIGSATAAVSIGRAGIGGLFEHFNGYIDDLRVTKGVARYTSDFTPPAAAFSAGQVGLTAPRVPTGRPARALIVASAVVPAHCAHRLPPVETVRDVEFGGSGRIAGTVKEKGTPDNTPLRRRVVLIDERSHTSIRETWSDTVTGNYEFKGVKQGVPYTVLSYDHMHNYRAVAADNLLAEDIP